MYTWFWKKSGIREKSGFLNVLISSGHKNGAWTATSGSPDVDFLKCGKIRKRGENPYFCTYLLAVFMKYGAWAATSGSPAVHCWQLAPTVTSGGGPICWFLLESSLASITAEDEDPESGKNPDEEDEEVDVMFWESFLVTHLGGSGPLPRSTMDDNKGGKSLAKSNWSLVEVVTLVLIVAAASIVSPSETTELVVLFMVSNDCDGRKADLRRRL